MNWSLKKLFFFPHKIKKQKHIRNKKTNGWDFFFLLVFILFKMVDAETEVPQLNQVLIVRDFIDVFPDDLSRLSPYREIEFCIDLVSSTEPISMVPYIMIPTKLRELKDHLQDLLDKEFIQPSVFSWGALMLFVKNKNKSLRLCIDYKQLNHVAVRYKYLFPYIDNLFVNYMEFNYFP